MTTPVYVAAAGVAAALVLASCGAAPDEGGADVTAKDYTACMVSDDDGFDERSLSRSGAEGLDRAEVDLGVDVIKVASTAESDYVPNITNLLAQDCDLVIGVGRKLKDAMRAAAEANEDVDFALVDSAFSDADLAPVDLPNGKPLLFNTQEAAFLAGYLAAAVTETGTVATFGGLQIPSVSISMDGFADGVDRYNEETGETVTLLGWDKGAQAGSFSGDFTDQAQGLNFAQGFIDEDADVIMPVAGPVGLGAAAALQDAGGLLVGVDTDWFETAPQYSSIILTSVLKEVDRAVYDTVVEAVAGGFDPAPYVGTLENGGIDLAPFHDFASAVPADVATRVDELKTQIIDGDLTVESVSAR